MLRELSKTTFVHFLFYVIRYCKHTLVMLPFPSIPTCAPLAGGLRGLLPAPGCVLGPWELRVLAAGWAQVMENLTGGEAKVPLWWSSVSGVSSAALAQWPRVLGLLCWRCPQGALRRRCWVPVQAHV